MFRFKRIFVAFLCLFIIAGVAYCDAISDFASSRAINAPSTAVLITDLRSGASLAALNDAKPLVPASIMKSVTTATLLEKIGPSFVYETGVYADGRIDGATLDGNLLVCASGDPTVNSQHEPASADFIAEIVDALKGAGITEITGTINIDQSSFPGFSVHPSWQQGDLPHAYGTGNHGFNFRDNASGKKSVANPASVFCSALRSALASASISVGNASVNKPGKRSPLLTHRSSTVDEIMRSCMMRSDNQYAEAMLRRVGLEYGGEGSLAEGARRVAGYWKALNAPMDSVTIVDGSGLSRSNRVTARFMTFVLRHMWRNPYYASFFPLAGQEGTLRKFLAGTPLEGYIAMKTGSMNGIQCYAGYKLDDDYMPTHSVVVIMNDMANRAAARAEVEKLLLDIFN